MRMSVRSALLGVVFAAGLAGAAQAQFYPPVPPLRYEVVPVAPGPAVLWQPGHWGWNGFRYAWVGGRYLQRRPYYANYQHGHWASRFGRWVWVRPGWG